eukprot:61150-Pyramimonas_sp.AAC.1
MTTSPATFGSTPVSTAARWKSRVSSAKRVLSAPSRYMEKAPSGATVNAAKCHSPSQKSASVSTTMLP